MREIDVHLHDGLDVVSACRKAGISDKTYYYWRKKFGGLGRPQLSEMKALKKEKERTKKRKRTEHPVTGKIEYLEHWRHVQFFRLVYPGYADPLET